MEGKKFIVILLMCSSFAWAGHTVVHSITRTHIEFIDPKLIELDMSTSFHNRSTRIVNIRFKLLTKDTATKNTRMKSEIFVWTNNNNYVSFPALNLNFRMENLLQLKGYGLHTSAFKPPLDWPIKPSTNYTFSGIISSLIVTPNITPEGTYKGIFTFFNPNQANVLSFTSVDAVLGRGATLPCNIDPEIREDRVYMVLWYRERYPKPIYSFDVRGRPFTKALHWSDPDVFGPRAYFLTVSQPATLTLDGVQLDDEGIYRCRIDFRTTPTRNFAINLTVIVPPHQLLVYDNSGRDISGVVGPLEEGTGLILTCEVRGGSPRPTVSWFVNDRMVESRRDETGTNVITNRLEVTKVGRDHLNSTYKCQASNTKLMMPAEKTVRLEMLLRPLSVTILQKPRQMVAEDEYQVQCEVVGSRPRAQVIWTRDNRPFRRGKVSEEANETSLISSVTFAPVPEDDGTLFKCIGDNPKLVGVGKEDSFTLNVVYPPQVSLHLGSTLNPEDIKDGDDVYFECNIRANPKHHKITWFHDGFLVSQNMSSGIIISTHSLVLQRVTRWQSGAYTCMAVNPRGETTSKPVLLRVRFAPVCRDTDITIIGASLDEVLRVRCHVSADPADVTFTWQFNNSGESFDLSAARFSTSSGNVSELLYTSSSQRDYGTLTCWGRNSIGRQLEPCAFQVVPAAKPTALSNCTLRAAASSASLAATNHSLFATSNTPSDALEVECRPGYDGGLPQRFILEAYDPYTMRLRLNISTPEYPIFRVDLADLGATAAATTIGGGDGGFAGNTISTMPPSLRIVVYAMNAKGRSEKLILEDITLNDAEKRTDGTSNISILPIAALLTGSLLTLGIAVLLIIVLAVRRRHHCLNAHCNHHHHHHHHHHAGSDGLAPIAIGSKQQPKITPQPLSRPGSMLEINTGDHRYVVAYTLKPIPGGGVAEPTRGVIAGQRGEADGGGRQPDILNTPRGNDSSSPNGPLTRAADDLFPSPVDRGRTDFANFSNSNVTSPALDNQHLLGTTNASQTTTTSTLGRHSRGRPRDAGQPTTTGPPYGGSNFATMRRDHIIADSIPGPESCV